MSQKSEFTTILQEWTQVFMHRSFFDFKRFMDESGLSASQVSTLMRLYHSGPCGVTNISHDLDISNAASSQLVERLVQQGLIERTEHRVDRRVRQIRLTAKGQALIEAGIEARRHWMEGLTIELTPEQQSAIMAALSVLTEAARKLDMYRAEAKPLSDRKENQP